MSEGLQNKIKKLHYYYEKHLKGQPVINTGYYKSEDTHISIYAFKSVLNCVFTISAIGNTILHVSIYKHPDTDTFAGTEILHEKFKETVLEIIKNFKNLKTTKKNEQKN